jgi:hypothetical protein
MSIPAIAVFIVLVLLLAGYVSPWALVLLLLLLLLL